MAYTIISLGTLLLVAMPTPNHGASAYCCPGGQSTTISVEHRSRVVKFTRMAKTGQIITGYKATFNCKEVMGSNHNPTDAKLLDRVFGHGTETTPPPTSKTRQKRFWLFGRDKTDISKSCPIYKDVIEPITDYRLENYDVPVLKPACNASEQICCKGYVRMSNNECQTPEDAQKLKDPKLSKLLNELG